MCKRILNASRSLSGNPPSSTPPGAVNLRNIPLVALNSVTLPSSSQSRLALGERVDGHNLRDPELAGELLISQDLAFYRTRLKRFREAYNARDLATLTPLEVDEYLGEVGTGMSDSTRHHNALALERLQKFALENRVLDRPVFGKLEKPRVGQRDRLPTADETAAILSKASKEFRLIYSALRQCGARPGELCRATIADVDRTTGVITLKEHKTARKTGKPRRIPIGRKLGELLDQAIGTRSEGPVFRSPKGRQWKVANLSRKYSRLRDDAGLPKDLVLYLARHECGTKICREKGIEYARRLLGHANISTTQRYMHLDDRELADAQDLAEYGP